MTQNKSATFKDFLQPDYEEFNKRAIRTCHFCGRRFKGRTDKIERFLDCDYDPETVLYECMDCLCETLSKKGEEAAFQRLVEGFETALKDALGKDTLNEKEKAAVLELATFVRTKRL